MKQSGNSIQGPNLQPFLDSAANAAAMGQRQFFTPPAFAGALATPFRRLDIQAVVDLQAGDGQLLSTAVAGHRLGIDIDSRSPAAIPGKHAFTADCTAWYPLAVEAGFKADLILGNPPFSLQWHADRLDSLRRSPLPGLPEAFAAAISNAGTIDSTAAALLMAISLLSDRGEGYLICNASTARRLLGDPLSDLRPADYPLAPIMRYLWAWLEAPNVGYQGIHTVFDTAVLYFARGHGEHATGPQLPLFLTSPSADPDTVTRTLGTALSARPHARHGREVKESWESHAATTLRAWEAVRAECQRIQQHETRPSWNIWLKPDGTIGRNLTTFQRLAVPHATITLLNELEGAHPAALVVQRPTRQALRSAVESGIWRVHPDVHDAVAKAISEYDSVRAPFFLPNEVQSMGWLDEESTIPCTAPGLEGIHPGDLCPLATWVGDTAWTGTRPNYSGDIEHFSYSGRQLVIEITAPGGQRHQFHVRRDDDAKDSRLDAGVWHHDQSLLPRYFRVPCPRDIASVFPERHAEMSTRLAQIEAAIRDRLALAG